MNKIKDFSLKFIDIMVGIVLGLGFQWWVNLKEPWQYVAFIFVYLDIVDYWIDYAPSLKKFPPKREIDVMLDVGIMFTLFLYIYTTQLSIIYFLGSFIIFKILDFFWLLSSKHEYNPKGVDLTFVNVWLRFNLLEVFLTSILAFLAYTNFISSLVILLTFIFLRIVIRILASLQYKRIHFV